jgi:4-amino-4-deoxy-L-arabinose transferase-like glycosyltransferase
VEVSGFILSGSSLSSFGFRLTMPRFDGVHGMDSNRQAKLNVSLAIILGSVFLLTRLHEGDLAGYDDALYAHMAKNMIRSGDWWNVCFNGYVNPENPPMLIWLQAISMKLFGISDFAAKLPSALCGIAILPLVYAIGRKIFKDHWTPLAGMLIMLMTPYFLKYASHAMTDAPFMFFCTASVWCYLCSLDKPILMPAAGALTGFAILTRSVIGFIPLLFIIAHLTASGRLRKSLVPLIGCVLAAMAMPAVWFGSMVKLHPGFLSGHLGFLLSKTPPSEGSWIRWIAGLFQYPYLMAKNYWPWAILAAIGVWKYARRFSRSEKASLVLIIWVAAVLVPLSFAGSKVLRYIMPAFPAFSLLSAAVLAEWIPESRKSRVINWTMGVLIVIAAGFVSLPINSHKDRAVEARSLVSILKSPSVENERVLLYSRAFIPWDLRNQLVWYQDRPVDCATSLEDMHQKISGGNYRWAILDNETGKTLRLAESSFAGHSSAYVCLRLPE